MIEKLKYLNQALLKKYENNPQKVKTQKIIEKILKEKDCFFKMNIECAYSILRDLEVEENDIRLIYIKLISYQ